MKSLYTIYSFRRAMGWATVLETAVDELQEAEIELLNWSSQAENAKSQVRSNESAIERLSGYLQKLMTDNQCTAVEAAVKIPQRLATQELEGSKLALMKARSALEYSNALVAYNNKRIARLRVHIAAQTAPQEVQAAEADDGA